MLYLLKMEAFLTDYYEKYSDYIVLILHYTQQDSLGTGAFMNPILLLEVQTDQFPGVRHTNVL